MTFAIGRVEGGTGAGRKRQKPAPKPWTCRCVYPAADLSPQKREQPAYMTRCPDCGQSRPSIETRIAELERLYPDHSE